LPDIFYIKFYLFTFKTCKKITKKQIEDAKKWEILASGYLENSKDKVFLTSDPKAKKKVRYVAIRWCIADWVIYVENLYEDYIGRTDENIIKMWDKVPACRIRNIDDLYIKDEAIELYRR
jgi:hypothetical protein